MVNINAMVAKCPSNIKMQMQMQDKFSVLIDINEFEQLELLKTDQFHTWAWSDPEGE